MDPASTWHQDDGELAELVRKQDLFWRGLSRVEVWPGPAHEPDELPESTDEPWAVIDDPDELRDFVDALATVDLSARKVVQALAGIELVFFDAQGDQFAPVEMLNARWIRSYWPYDGLAARPVLPGLLESLSRGGKLLWDPALDAALGAIEGSVPPADSSHQLDLVRLSQVWRQRWPGLEPIGHRLRDADRWVRFHSLPGSKRYADDEHEYDEILRRHRMLLHELRQSTMPSDATSADVVRVVTCSWSCGSTPVPRSAPVARATPGAVHWMSVCTDEADGDFPPIITHAFVDQLSFDDPALARLLRLVADDRTGDVFVSDSDFTWLYHPYDGGADVIAADVAVRDRLRATYVDWLPTNPAGL